MRNEIVPAEYKAKIMVVRNAPAIKLGSDKERIERLKANYRATEKGLIDVGDRSINVSDVVGFFDEDEFEKDWKQRHGYWICSLGNFHENGKKCNPRECFLKNNESYQKVMAILIEHHADGCRLPESEWTYQERNWHLCPQTKKLNEIRSAILYEAENYKDLEY